jgi:prefoldin subunit 5|tara:strand:- start:203 stop:469 length:267 start_codon:yes stop_codon:yes gene_type:complete
MSIKKTIKFTTGSITLPPTSSSHVLPIGEQPEGNLNLEGALDKLGDTIKGLIQNINTLQENLNKLTKENQRLKEALGIVTIEEDSHGH